jgi:hypothetical protein
MRYISNVQNGTWAAVVERASMSSTPLPLLDSGVEGRSYPQRRSRNGASMPTVELFGAETGKGEREPALDRSSASRGLKLLADQGTVLRLLTDRGRWASGEMS